MRIQTTSEPAAALKSGLLLAVMLAVLAVSPTVASAASLSWSGPVALETRGGPPREFTAVACPSSTQCTVVDKTSGQQVTFNPVTGAAISGPTTIDATGGRLSAIACPSVSQCTAGDDTGNAVTFNPQSPGTPTATLVYLGNQVDNPLFAIACPSTTQCTATVGYGGGEGEITFNPQALGPTAVGAPAATGPVACATVSQCVAVDFNSGQEVTFNPQAPNSPVSAPVDPAGYLSAVECLSASRCTGVGYLGEAVTFNPTTGEVIVAATTIDATHSLISLSCPSATQCTAVDDFGQEFTFDPAAPTAATSAKIDGIPLFGVACPSAGQCTAVDNFAQVLTFDPTTGVVTRSTTFSSGHYLSAVACSTGSQCTAVDFSGREVTFDPTAPGAAHPVTIDLGNRLSSLACPSAGQCTAIDFNGREVTFDPASGAETSGPTTVDPPTGQPNDQSLIDVACPSVTQCTAIDFNGREVTFNPQSGVAQAPATVDNQLLRLSCPSTTQCTAVDSHANEVTFDPTSGTVLFGGPTLIDPSAVADNASLTGVACTSTTRCTAVDSITSSPTPSGTGARSGEVTFNPQDPGTNLDSNPIGAGGRFDQLRGVACPSASECVAVDAQGDAVEGDPSQPSSFRVEPIPGANSLNDVACPSVSLCVTVDRVGNAFVGTTSTSTSVVGSPSASDSVGASVPESAAPTAVVTPPAGAGTTQATGRLLLVRARLLVRGGVVSGLFACASSRACISKLSITTRARLGKSHKLATVVCATTRRFFKLQAHKRLVVRVGVRPACLSLLRRAAHHRIGAKLIANPRTGQHAVIRQVILYLKV